MIISICHERVFKQFRLPNTENIDHCIFLDKKIFLLTKNKKLDLENEDGIWYLKICRGLKASEKELKAGRIKLDDKKILSIEVGGGDLRLICCVNPAGLMPYKKFDLTSCSRFTVGSAEESDIFYSSLDLISKKHAVFFERGGNWFVSDLSTNGIFVDSKRVNGEQSLTFGNTVSIYGLEVVFLGDHAAIGSWYGEFLYNSDTMKLYTAPKPLLKHEKVEKATFNRSPRTIDHIYEEKIDIEPPPQIQTSKKTSVLATIGPSFTMALPMLMGCLLAIYNSKRSGATGSAFMYTGIITAMGSALIGSFWAYRNLKESRKTEFENENKRFRSYSEYLIRIADDIQAKYKNNFEVLNATYPSAETVCGYNENSVGLWNRNYYHKDFLFHRLGLGELPFKCELNIPKQKFSVNYDSLSNKPTKIGDQYKMLYNVPVGIDLMKDNLFGIVGATGKKGALDIMRALTAQIVANNCYTDVKLMYIYEEKSPVDRENWTFLRWLPHVYSESRKVRFIASNKLEAADVFYELANVIRKRLDEQEERKQTFVKPHYVVFIEDYRLLDDEPIAKYLLQPHNDYGVTVFILSDYYYNLPNVCENIIENDEYGTFIYNALDTENEKKKISFDKVSPQRLEMLAKTIADIRVSEGESDSEIPNSLSFFDMYGVKKLDELNVMERWRKNRTYNTMRALVGKKAGGADCYLDIHEKYHGPHGLVAGTTGSGKSETLQTFILSLALNFSPEDVAFLIIDFKGGGMANLFSGLPHMAGTISNLSGNQITRAMVSIKSEIKRRQVIFSENSVNNINAYTNLFKAKEAAISVPHLIIVIDEFAEMKREEPEFMKELISVAQVGRSLGIHLILATQKPGGTVDDNIWSNTKFRLCLRVQSRSDSMDMIHKPDAAYLSQAGRCYLQVGSDEIFELFQSGWSGAVYDPTYSEDSENTVTMISLTGKAAIVGNRAKIRRNELNKKRWLRALCTQYLKILPKYNVSIDIMDSFILDDMISNIISRLRSDGFKYGETKAEKLALIDFYKKYDNEYSVDLVNENVDDMLRKGIKLPELKEISQLDAVVDYLSVLSSRNGLDNQILLWLPPLSDTVYLSELEGYNELCYKNAHWEGTGKYFTLEVPVGLCDDPENQTQTPLVLDFAKTGHCAVIGSVVSGKSTFMQTVLYALCDRYSPERLNMYILDFSSRSLVPFENAPHCGGVLGEKDLDKVGKLLNLINKIIEERKVLFNGGTYAQYVKAYGVKVPAIIIAVDNFAGFNEKTENKYDSFFTRLAREGAGYGIFLFLSAQGFGMSEIPNRLADNIGNILTVNLGDKFKYMDVLRTTSIPMVPEIGVKGRGLAYFGERLLEYQTALCFHAEDGYARLEAMKKIFDKMSAEWSGETARNIPVIPTEPTLSKFKEEPDYKACADNKEFIPIGYRLADAALYCIDLSQIYCFTISGKPRTGKTNLLRIIIDGVLTKDANIVIFEKDSQELSIIGQNEKVEYIDDDKKLFDFLSALLPVFADRNKTKRSLSAKGMTNPEIYKELSKEKPYFIFINDLRSFFASVYSPSEGVAPMSGFVENIIEKGSLHNVYLFGCIDTDSVLDVSGYKAYSEFVKYKRGVHLGGCVSAQQIFSFQNIPFNETSRPYKKGIGLTPDDEDETQGVKIVIPTAGR